MINELEQQFNDLMKQGQELIEKMKELQQKKKPVKRWRADQGDEYCFIDYDGNIEFGNDKNSYLDKYRYSIGNYFKTQEEAEDYEDRLIVHQELKGIALELNEGGGGSVYSLTLDCSKENNIITFVPSIHNAMNVKCNDENFKSVAIERIGEDRLKNYLIKGV